MAKSKKSTKNVKKNNEFPDIPDETKKKLSEARKKRPPMSDETRRKLSESNKAAWIKRKLF